MKLSKETVGKLLGRTLTANEDANFEMYLNIAIERLQQQLCINLSEDDGARSYQSRVSHRTVYIDPCTAVNSVTIDGEVVDDSLYTVMLNDSLNSDWYNLIQFKYVRSGQIIEVDADWGFDTCPRDLQLLIARLFGQIGEEQAGDSRVKSKKIEDFTVTYKDSVSADDVLSAHATVLARYSQCVGEIRSGTVYPVSLY